MNNSEPDYLSLLIAEASGPPRLVYQQRADDLAQLFTELAVDLATLAVWLDTEGNEPTAEMMQTIDATRELVHENRYRHRARMHFLESLEYGSMFGRAAPEVRLYARMFLKAPTDDERSMGEEPLPETFTPTPAELHALIEADDEALVFASQWAKHLEEQDTAQARLSAYSLLATDNRDDLTVAAAALTFLAEYPELGENLTPALIDRGLRAFNKPKGRPRASKSELDKWSELAAVMTEIGIGGTKRLEQDWHDWQRGDSGQQVAKRERRRPEYASWREAAARQERKRLKRMIAKKKATGAT